MLSAPSVGAFTDLHTTMQIENADVAPLLLFFEINADILNGNSDNMLVKSAANNRSCN